MDVFGGHVHGPRGGRSRDRRGRGLRGPLSLPGPLSPRRIRAERSRRTAFDNLVAEIMRAITARGLPGAPPVEVAVEEAPLLPEGWTDEVPASSIHLREPGPGHRLVLYRLPITTRSRSGDELEDNVWDIVLLRLSEAWELPVEDIDPRAN
ncbi:metallopeptidase family protein [uncultured Aeromicrobium sp.]|uniref:metallopeptidase family protein n=1 Tax=uncultured Aeromicrobium sp. TaxID=337820 RepID=UPI0025EA43B4|nr:metallopeptidase family protein [uncultured Aeromicrobium sp.]